MGHEIVVEASSLQELKEKLDQLNQSIGSLQSSIESSLTQFYQSVPFTAPYSKGYKFLFGQKTLTVLDPGNSTDVLMLEKESGYIIHVLGILVGSANVNISLEFETSGAISILQQNMANTVLFGAQRASSMLRLLKFDPVSNIYVLETFPPNFVTFFDGYIRVSIQNLSTIPIMYAYDYIVAIKT